MKIAFKNLIYFSLLTILFGCETATIKDYATQERSNSIETNWERFAFAKELMESEKVFFLPDANFSGLPNDGAIGFIYMLEKCAPYNNETSMRDLCDNTGNIVAQIYGMWGLNLLKAYVALKNHYPYFLDKSAPAGLNVPKIAKATDLLPKEGVELPLKESVIEASLKEFEIKFQEHRKKIAAMSRMEFAEYKLQHSSYFSLGPVGFGGVPSQGLKILSYIILNCDKTQASEIMERVFRNSLRKEAKIYAIWGLYLLGKDEAYKEHMKEMSGTAVAMFGCIQANTDIKTLMPGPDGEYPNFSKTDLININFEKMYNDR